MNTYNCDLYNLISSQREDRGVLINENSTTLKELQSNLTSQEYRDEKVNEQIARNKELLQSQLKSVTSFQHCGKCEVGYKEKNLL